MHPLVYEANPEREGTLMIQPTEKTVTYSRTDVEKVRLEGVMNAENGDVDS